MICSLKDCDKPQNLRGVCRVHLTKLRRLYMGENPLISEQELVDKGILTAPKGPGEVMSDKITYKCKEWLDSQGITILRLQR